MSASASTFEEILADQFGSTGLTEAGSGIFVRDLHPGLKLWVSPRVTKEKGTNHPIAAPVLGAIAVDVEEIVDACRSARAGKHAAVPTLSIQVGYLLRGHTYREWRVNLDNPRKTAQDVEKSVDKATKRLEKLVPDLAAVGERLQEAEWAYRHQARYRIPVTALLVDGPSAASVLLDQMVGEASEAGGEVATAYSEFANRFRGGYLD